MKTSEQCVGFHPFLLWQLERLREAIAEDRHYMGENLRRTVSFAEAEQDFFDHNGYGCPAKWRAEYCLNLCPNRSHCPLARTFTAAA